MGTEEEQDDGRAAQSTPDTERPELHPQTEEAGQRRLRRRGFLAAAAAAVWSAVVSGTAFAGEPPTA